jgi:hypothetical protein
MYWSAAFWTIGRTVVEPLIVIVCRSPEEDADACPIAAVEGTDGVPAAPAGAMLAACVWVGAGALVSGVVQPAASARIITATRLTAITGNLFCFPLMMFYHPFDGVIYTDFRHKL